MKLSHQPLFVSKFTQDEMSTGVDTKPSEYGVSNPYGVATLEE
jgi:hypothetical protein